MALLVVWQSPDLCLWHGGITSTHQQPCEAGASHQRRSCVGHAASMDGTSADLHNSIVSQDGQLQEHSELRETAVGLSGGSLSVLQQDDLEAQQGASSLQEAWPASDRHPHMCPFLP